MANSAATKNPLKETSKNVMKISKAIFIEQKYSGTNLQKNFSD
jgi:hypothetical protein